MPVYEQPIDRDRARRIAAAAAQVWNCQMVEAKEMTPHDFYATRDRVITAVVEVKWKHKKRRDYPCVYIDVAKVRKLLDKAREHGVKALFVARFTDDAVWVDVSRVLDCGVGLSGRNDRQDSLDADWAYHVPHDRVKRLNLMPEQFDNLEIR